MYWDENVERFRMFFDDGKKGDDCLERLKFRAHIDRTALLRVLMAAKIHRFETGYNSFGEFMFIYFSIFGADYFVYGLGLHEFRKKIYMDCWIMNGANAFSAAEREKVISFDEIRVEIERKEKVVGRMKEPAQDRESDVFSQIADMADEDFALETYFDLT